jgi:hypothetical protein
MQGRNDILKERMIGHDLPDTREFKESRSWAPDFYHWEVNKIVWR